MTVTETPPETVDAASRRHLVPGRSRPGWRPSSAPATTRSSAGSTSCSRCCCSCLVAAAGGAFARRAARHAETLDVLDERHRRPGLHASTRRRRSFLFAAAAHHRHGHRRRAPPGGRPHHRLPPGRGRLVLDLARSAAASSSPPTPSNGGPGGGGADGVDLWIVAIGLVVVVARCSASVCIATTVLALRPPGMTLDAGPAVRLVDRSSPRHVAASRCRCCSACSSWSTSTTATAGALRRRQRRALRQHRLGVRAARRSTPSPSRSLGFVGDVVADRLRHPPRSCAAWPWAPSAPSASSSLRRLPAWRRARPTSVSEPLYVGVAVAGRRARCSACSALVGRPRSAGARSRSTAGARLRRRRGPDAAPRPRAGALGSIEPLDARDGDARVSAPPSPASAHAVVLAAVIAALGGLALLGPQDPRPPAGNEGVGLARRRCSCWSAPLASPSPTSSRASTGDGVGRADRPDGIEALNIVVARRRRRRRASASSLAVVSLAAVAPQASDDDVPADPWGGQTLEWATGSPPPLRATSPSLPVVDLGRAAARPASRRSA